MSITKLYTAEDLSELDPDAPYELIEGELIEVPPSHTRSSEIAGEIFAALRAYVRRNRLCRLSVADGGYILARNPDTVVAPDVGFVSASRLPGGFPDHQHVPLAPDLAVEVMSSTARFSEVERKAQRYLDAGRRLVWVVHPDPQTVHVYALDRPVQQFGDGETLDGEDVVPWFRLGVEEIFA